MPPGIHRDDLRPRYNVASIVEDHWHSYSGTKTAEFIKHELGSFGAAPGWMLNAGSGANEINDARWLELSLDLFVTPIRGRRYGVCGSVERLPFPGSCFQVIICVGEVLAYCDPAVALREFARVIKMNGLLIFDFGNSESFKRWLRQGFGRSADLITDVYNGAPEKTWVYSPTYIASLLQAAGFQLRAKLGTHTWSALARRLGASSSTAVSLQENLEWLRLPISRADLTTFSAVRVKVEK